MLKENMGFFDFFQGLLYLATFILNLLYIKLDNSANVPAMLWYQLTSKIEMSLSEVAFSIQNFQEK